MASVVPPLTPIMQAMVRRYFGPDAAGGRSGIERRHADSLRAARRGRRRPHREQHRGVRALRQGRGIRAHRRGSRDGDDVRRRDGEGRVSRRRHLPGSADRRRGAVSARGAPAARRRAQAGRRSSVATTLGAIESGLFYGYLGMVEGLVARMTESSAAARRPSRPAGWRRSSRPRRPSSLHVEPDITLLRAENRVGTEQRSRERGLPIGDCGLLPGDRSLPLPEKRRPSDPGRRAVVRARSGWAADGVPLKIAFAGIDRYFERYYRKGPRRRPVRIDFCDADVLDVFDEWRRAVGLTAARTPGEPTVHEGSGNGPGASRPVACRRISSASFCA